MAKQTNAPEPLAVLDTHTAIWFFNGDSALSETAKKIILDTSNIKYLSIASAWFGNFIFPFRKFYHRVPRRIRFSY